MSFSTLIRAGALAAFCAALLLVAQFVIALGMGPGYVLLGTSLDPAAVTAFLRANGAALTRLMASDDAFVLAYTLAFTALAVLVRQRARLIGALALVFALGTALTDFVENSLTLGLVAAADAGQTVETGWLLALLGLGQVKYLQIYLAAVLFAVALWSAGRFARALAALLLLFPVIGLMGVVFPPLALVKILWMLVLLSVGGVWLWQQRAASYEV